MIGNVPWWCALTTKWYDQLKPIEGLRRGQDWKNNKSERFKEQHHEIQTRMEYLNREIFLSHLHLISGLDQRKNVILFVIVFYILSFLFIYIERWIASIIGAI